MPPTLRGGYDIFGCREHPAATANALSPPSSVLTLTTHPGM